ncbi:MAG: endonuclease [Bacillota bacterium]
MKKLLTLITLLLTSFTLFACDMVDEVTDEPIPDDETPIVDEDDESQINLTVLSNIENVNYSLSNEGPYEAGDRVTITLESTPEAWQFSHYESNDDIVATDASYTFTIDSDMTLEIVLETTDDSEIESFYEDAVIGDTYTLEGTVFAAYDGGYYITDGMHNVNIYDDSLTASPGDTVQITGTVSNYYTMLQLTDVTETTLTDDAVSYVTSEATVSEILALDAANDPTVSGRVYSVTATLDSVTSGQYTNLILSDDNESITLYYNASQDALNALNGYIGQTIEIEVLYYTDHDSDGVYVLFYGNDSDITVIDDNNDSDDDDPDDDPDEDPNDDPDEDPDEDDTPDDDYINDTMQTLLDEDLIDYYNEAEGLYGEDLEASLGMILNSEVSGQSYDAAKYILEESDRDPDNPNNIILVYTRESIKGAWDYPNWNREHVWPQSKLNGSGAKSDVHHLKPSDVQENSSRGNLPFGTTGGTYEPPDEVKGDIARIVFYMDARYDELSINSSTIGDLSMLLEWHINDPVDDFERNRNDVIYSYQNNRNPFIDHPHLALLLYHDTYDFE